MGWNDDPKVRDVANLCQSWGYDRMIVLAINDREGTFATVSYGRNKPLCDSAKKINEQIYNMVSEGTIEIDT